MGGLDKEGIAARLRRYWQDDPQSPGCAVAQAGYDCWHRSRSVVMGIRFTFKVFVQGRLEWSIRERSIRK